MRLVGATAFPMVMAAGATGDPGDAYTIAAAAATEGRAVGIHVNFAPDADVNNNPANPIINIRSFGEDLAPSPAWWRSTCGVCTSTPCWRRSNTSPATGTRRPIPTSVSL